MKPEDKNHVEHSDIYILGTINYTNRYRFYRAVNALVNQMSEKAAIHRQTGRAAPSIRIHIDCPDKKMYDKQAAPMFEMIKRALNNGVIVENYVFGRTSGWASTFAACCASSGFRNMYESSCHFYFEQNVQNPNQKKLVELSPTECIALGFCDNILTHRGQIISRDIPR